MKAYRLPLVLLPLIFLQACVTATSPATLRAASNEEVVERNLELGSAYIRRNQPDRAIDPLERALEIDPRHVGAQQAIAMAYDQMGDVDQAEEHYRRAAELDRTNPDTANAYAVFLCRNDRWSDAEPYFVRAAQNPSYRTPAVALTNAGMCARSAGDNVKADQYFREALARDATYPDALLNLMELSYEEGNYISARAFMQRYLENQPATANILKTCVLVERALNNPNGANDCESRLRREFPGSQEYVELQQLGADATGR